MSIIQAFLIVIAMSYAAKVIQEYLDDINSRN